MAAKKKPVSSVIPEEKPQPIKHSAPDFKELAKKKYASLHDAKSRCDFDNYFQASKENDEALERWHKYMQE